MQTSEWVWKTSDGLEICSRAWLPDGAARGVICLVHGVGEHIGRYVWDAEAFTAAGYILAGFDQRGYGQSQGQRGYVRSFEVYFDDIDAFLGEVTRRWPDQKRFLYGHSMGAILVLAYTPVRKPRIAGVIATAPGLKSSVEEQKGKVALAKVLGQLMPALSMDNGIDVNAICRDPKVVEAYLNDPLVHRRVTTGWGKAMLDDIALAFKHAGSFPQPLLLLHGGNDEIAYPSSSTAFAELAPKDKVTLKIWDGFKHELHTDPERAQVFKVMVDWLDQH